MSQFSKEFPEIFRLHWTFLWKFTIDDHKTAAGRKLLVPLSPNPPLPTHTPLILHYREYSRPYLPDTDGKPWVKNQAGRLPETIV